MTTLELEDGECTHIAALPASTASGLLLKNGPLRTGDLEDILCGEQNLFRVLLGNEELLDAWRNSPFFPALALLVDAGEVAWRRDPETEYVWYSLED